MLRRENLDFSDPQKPYFRHSGRMFAPLLIQSLQHSRVTIFGDTPPPLQTIFFGCPPPFEANCFFCVPPPPQPPYLITNERSLETKK